jgi:N-acyl-D-aspartate/D-glutamate deacylase
MGGYDLVIKGGTVVDGLQTPRFRADVAVADGRIVQIGRVSARDGTEVVDASGRVVAPGVVDLHTHYDGQLFWDPWCTMSGWHGVTTVVIGNCGFGFAPCKPEHRDRAMLSLSRNEAVPLRTMQAGLPWDWETFPQLLDSIDRTAKGVNVMSFVPLAPLYGYAVGIDEAKKRPATGAELERMCELLIEGMQAGGCGMSAQINGEVGNVQLDFDGTPMVTDLMSERDLGAFCRAMGALGRGVTQVTTSLETAAYIARESARPVIWNTLVADGAVTQHGPMEFSHRDVLRRLAELNEHEGVRVYAQTVSTNFASEFTFEHYNLSDNVACWKEALLGTVEEKRVKLADPVRRRAMKDDYHHNGGVFGVSRYKLDEIEVHWVSSDLDRATELKDLYEGFTIGEIARREHKHPVDAMLDVAVAGELRVGFATPVQYTPPAAMGEILNAPVALPGVSDGGAHTKFITAGRYPSEVLGLWVREHGLMSLEQAHWRLSAYPAMAAGLRGRGYLAEGAPADLIVYDPETVGSRPAERLSDYPAGEWRLVQRATGYDRIVVNGKTTFVDGECTGETPGRLLRHGAD